MKTTTRPSLKNEKGMATIEIVPLVAIFLFLSCYTMGAFGVIHTGIKHSISARAYTFETFRNRTNLVYFRDSSTDATPVHYKNIGNRIHTVVNENREGADGDRIVPSERPLRVGLPLDPLETRTDLSVHNEKIHNDILPSKRNETIGVNPVWIQVQYGICLNAGCGG